MKRLFYRIVGLFIAASLILPACGTKPATCQDPLGCVVVESSQPIKIAVLLTLSGPDAPYGIDALRGVEIAVQDHGEVLGHAVEVVQVDDLCTEAGGLAGAQQIAADSSIVGAVGATCSSGSVPAGKILTEAGMILISPSSTAPSLTLPKEYQAGFFRTIYNDRAQGKAVAEFAYQVLGLRSMSTIDDKTPYSTELALAACENFEKLGGECRGRIHIDTGSDVAPQMLWISRLKTDVLYYPLYTVDGVNVMRQVDALGITSALISSDGLLSGDFVSQTADINQGMYLSGPAPVPEDQAFIEKYRLRYGEEPNASYHLQGYDAAMLIFEAIKKIATSSGGNLIIGRQAMRDAIRNIREYQGLSGILTCSQYGDCAAPNISIFQVRNSDFSAIYP